MTPRRAVLALLGSVPLWLALHSCGSGKAAHTDRPPLLDRAIAAAGGEARLAAIRSVEARLHGELPGGPYRVTVQRLLPDRYRSDVEVSDALLVQATDGTEVWSTLDDLPVPVTAEDADTFREALRIDEVSMLLPLKRTGLEIREEVRDDRSELLRVTFPEDPRFPNTPRGPFVLSFEAGTTFLKTIEFDSMISGSRRTRRVRIERLDYRNVDGIMVPFVERISDDRDRSHEDRVDQIVVNPEIPPERFQRPEPRKDLVIRVRQSAEVMVALFEHVGARPEAAADAEAALKRYLDKYDLTRNGPSFRLQPLSDGEYPAVGVPIAPPPATTRPTSRPTTRELPRICVLPARTILTTMIPGTDPASRSAAIERLLARARSDGFEPAGPCKIVLWPAAVQLQVPVRPKKG